MRLLEAAIYNYLVGNNDEHGKNFSLLYRGIGTENPAIRLAPLYDFVSTLYYPELSRDMAMKIGGEYSSAKVTPRNFEQLGLGKPLVRVRVPQMAERVIVALEKVKIAHPDAEKVVALIRRRSEKVRDSFRN
jgi:serine/threonine-protein kinase HipA